MSKKKPITAAELQSMGGKARAAALSKTERSEIARKAGKARAESLSADERSRDREEGCRRARNKEAGSEKGDSQ